MIFQLPEHGLRPSKCKKLGSVQNLAVCSVSSADIKTRKYNPKPIPDLGDISSSLNARIAFHAQLSRTLTPEEWHAPFNRMRCRCCTRGLSLTPLHRCKKCHYQFSMSELLEMRAKAAPWMLSPDKRPIRMPCAVCGRKPKHTLKELERQEEFESLDLSCPVFIDGVTQIVRACSPDCQTNGMNRYRNLTSCVEQAERQQERERRELLNLKSVLSAMRAGLKEMNLKASRSQEKASPTLGTSQN